MQEAFPGMGLRLEEKIEKAVETLRTFAPQDGSRYWLAYSGGKDSGVLKWLADRAGVPYEAHYSVTTVDPPELVRFIRRHHPDVKFDRPKKPLWAAIADHGMPPTRLCRWCCEDYKESRGEGLILVGVRAYESARRAKRWRVVNPMRRNGRQCTLIAPMLLWTDEDVWALHRREGIPYCSLYDEGFKRLGCVLCPMAGTNAWGKRQKERDILRWPKIAALWRKGIFLAWARREREGRLDESEQWKTPEAMWTWWLWQVGAPKGEPEACDGLGLFV